MAVAIEVSIGAFSSTPAARGHGWAGAATAPMELVVPSAGPVTSPYVSAGAVFFADVSESVGSGLATGSWVGTAMSVAIIDNAVTAGGGTSTGSWSGTTDSVGVAFMGPDERNRSIATSDNPSPNQGAALTDWNFFPLPAAPAPLVGRARDLTRYQKAYSSARHMPVRVRLYRR